MKKLITFYSESHIDMFNIFKDSCKKYLKNFELKPKNINQLSPTGEYESLGFDLTMLEKIKWIIENIDINDDNLMIFSDCDVQFFNDVDEDLGENDIMFQEDLGTYCAGFFICKQNKQVLDFFNSVFNILKTNLDGKIHDQTIINHLFKNGLIDGIKVGLLNKNKYWTIANVNGGKLWNDGDGVSYVPNEIITHHANFTIGTKNKINLLNEVRLKYEQINI
jgi:hypothetical protein